jgi:hypothetical protein
MFLVAHRPRRAIVIQSRLEGVAIHVARMARTGRPVRRPADILDEAARQAEGEIDPHDPGAFRVQPLLEIIEARPADEPAHTEDVAVERAAGDPDRLALFR